jgi:hypothetical protein
MFLALILAWIIFTFLVKIIRTTVVNALMIAALVLLLQVGYGIDPIDIFNYIVTLPQRLLNSGGR